MNKQKFNIIIPVDMKPRPKAHEETAAFILANHFKANVKFIETGNQGTPDLSINGIDWELKSPIGNGKHNIQKNLREAERQSENVILDLRRSKLHQTRALGYIRQFVNNPNKLKRVIVITKSKHILTIK